MIPIRDAVPSRTRPIVTLAIVAATASATLLFSLIPAGGLDLSAFGDATGPGLTTRAPEWIWAAISLVRPSSWFQCITCALALWIFGPTVEDRVGHGRFVALYAGCGVAAAAAAAAAGTLPATGVLLLSGAVAGVIGAHAVLYPKARTLVLIPAPRGLDVGDVPAVLLASIWVVAQLANSLVAGAMPPGWSPRLALVQVIVGIVAGGAAVVFLKRPERMRVEWWNL